MSVPLAIGQISPELFFYYINVFIWRRIAQWLVTAALDHVCWQPSDKCARGGGKLTKYPPV
jgi:hypothetical protein